MPIYEDYARVYDASGQLAFSERMIPYLGRLVARHPVEGQSTVDVACGTGTVAIAQAQAGWSVYGVDGSSRMLALAEDKARRQGVEIAWGRQDMRCFSLPERVSLATCLYDSMNYMLSDADLLSVFQSTYECLLPGGLFLFDMNTAWAMAALWDDETFLTDTDDLTVMLESAYEPRDQRTTVKVVCFQRLGELYEKVSEVHTEQAYPPEHVAMLLADAGLRIEAQYECFTLNQPTPTTFRIMYVARRSA